MKLTIMLTLFLIIRIIAQDYFPLEVGNTWTYCNNSDTLDTITYHVADSLNINNIKYFLYGNISHNYYIDTIRKDIEGNIWKKIDGIDYLWFDFTKESGAAYTFPSFDSLYAYEIKLYKYFTLQTCNRTYSQCIELSFDIPQYRDADILYSFAPQIGLIEIYGGESPHYLLYSSLINGFPLGIVNDRLSSNLFELMQNYPNPFNPITKISYQIPEGCNVTLKVFDCLGNEIETLINSFQDKGFYSVDFNASKLFSGIYFYQLKANNFISTKKMLVIK
jgi:hypothetical protein